MIYGKKTALCIVLAALLTLTLASGAFASEEDVILSDDASDFVLLSDAVPDAILEIRYYSTYNFVGARIDGYEEPLALLTKEAAAALKEVSDDVMEQGYRLKIYDAYRPQMAVTNFMNWALDTEDTRMKEYFYPELEKDVLFPQGYIAEHSGHSRGSTVDLTLFDMTTEKEVDMGGTFDYFGELSHPDYTGITEEQYANRMILRDAMLAHGFKPLAEEWWHFTLADEPYPDTYFTFPVNSDSVDETTVSLANPWTDASVEEIESSTGFTLVVPDGVDVSSRFMTGMAEASWNWNGVEVTERVSRSDETPAMDTETLTELSGVYFTGLATQSKELIVGGRCPGYMEFCRGDLGAVMWYDEEPGLVYTVSFDKTADPKYLGDTAEWITPLRSDAAEDSPSPWTVGDQIWVGG